MKTPPDADRGGSDGRKGTTRSRSASNFLAGAKDTEVQLQLVEAGLQLIAGRIKTSKETIAEAIGASAAAYPALASKHIGLVSRARRNNFEFAFHRSYALFNSYCREILGELFEKKPLLVVAKAQGSLQFHEVVQLGNL